MNKIPAVLVGTGPFALQRLKIINESNLFEIKAVVDIDIDFAKKKISKDYPNLKEKIFSTITEAKKNENINASFIFATTHAHSSLSIESLENNLHTYCVKSVSLNVKQFKNFYKIKKKFNNLIFFQGYNNQWNQASLKMKDLIQNDLGNLLGGNCICWGRQNLKRLPPQDDVLYEGMFFHTLACHQLSQLVSSCGLPNYVTAKYMNRIDEELDYRGVNGTSGGQAFFEYKNNIPFCYTGIRAGHGNPFGFASRWSGVWNFHGENADLVRNGGRLTLYKKGNSVKDFYLKDLDEGLVDDEMYQIKNFYNDITNKNLDSEIQKNSIDIWILLEACNISASGNEKVNIQKFKNDLLGIK